MKQLNSTNDQMIDYLMNNLIIYWYNIHNEKSSFKAIAIMSYLHECFDCLIMYKSLKPINFKDDDLLYTFGYVNETINQFKKIDRMLHILQYF
jgi:hypothetical protein